MMENETIRVGNSKKRILINDGPAFIEFDPNDIAFAEKFYKVTLEFEKKRAEVEKLSGSSNSRSSSSDSPVITEDITTQIEKLKGLCSFMFEQIDYLFGEGTSRNIFGGSMSLPMIADFFAGLSPFVTKARAEKLNKYIGSLPKKQVGRRK
jgi:hypothetical protein